MFKINTNNTVKRQITVYIPTDGEGFSKGSFSAELRILSEPDIQALGDQGISSLVDKALVGVDGVADADGNPLAADVAYDAIKNSQEAIAAIGAELVEMTKGRNLRRGKSR